MNRRGRFAEANRSRAFLVPFCAPKKELCEAIQPSPSQGHLRLWLGVRKRRKGFRCGGKERAPRWGVPFDRAKGTKTRRRAVCFRKLTRRKGPKIGSEGMCMTDVSECRMQMLFLVYSLRKYSRLAKQKPISP